MAGTVSIAWDPVSDSDVAGYVVYWGTTSGVYTNQEDVGLAELFERELARQGGEQSLMSELVSEFALTSAEALYLARLGSVVKFGFSACRLMLQYIRG